VQELPAKLGTRRHSDSSCKSCKLGTSLVVGFCYVSSVCYQVAPCYSDHGADLGQHARGLDKYMTDDVGKLLLKFFDLVTRFIFSSSSRIGD
jgi:hypothetical protein